MGRPIAENLARAGLAVTGHTRTPARLGDDPLPFALAARAVGDVRTHVRSFHHQGVRRLPDGLRACGRAAGEATVEAIEDPAHPFALGVLWHPEEDEASEVIGALVRAARERRR